MPDSEVGEWQYQRRARCPASCLSPLTSRRLPPGVPHVAVRRCRGAGACSPAPGAELTKGSVVVLIVSKGPRTGTQPPIRRVPNVVGLAQRVAVARLQSAGFRVDSYPVASRRPRGTVIAQGPPGGSRRAPSSVVRIDVSLGSGKRPLRTVPDVVGMKEPRAKSVLVQAGFTVRSEDRVAADRSEKDVVLDQRPAAGVSAPAASQVILAVGRFPPPAS